MELLTTSIVCLLSCCTILAVIINFKALLSFFFFLFFFFFSSPRGSNNRRLPLPPGSLGWPYIGETFQLYSQDPNVFFDSKQKSYGSIFKTHILGCPCVMISSSESVEFVLATRADLFKPTFPASKERILGKHNFFFHRGDYHLKLRNLVRRAFMPESIRNMVRQIESIALGCLASMEGRPVVNAFQEMKTYAFNVVMLAIFGKEDEETQYWEDLKRCYHVLEEGYNSMPFDIPGTLFHRSMRARRELGLILSKIISTRRIKNNNGSSSSNSRSNDLLRSFMDDREGLSDEQIADNVIGIIFAARDTTASVLTWSLKFLCENPSALSAVTEEQEAIKRGKEGKIGEVEGGLSWADTRRMPVTLRVFHETLRLASILSFTFREAVQDVECQGYLIPKGWKVLPLFRNIHHNPDNFPEPHKFDASRFEVAPKPNTFLPFGSGVHSCLGNELARLEILVLLHHITTKYKWSRVGSERGIQYGPFALPMNGLPIRLSSVLSPISHATVPE
ncbi:hypothetical protein SAY87_029388 [Trapa incisa]|uniref:(+)-abscisic acid 8'-hydroxylase n=1 Tax=Trapa incisa TaxID=236973 RepID=A0AAN7KAZ7_9MYRT|nr:hypothetical protein SAY87_029388 [Trapa incisa]